MARPATVAVVEDDPDVRELHRLRLRDAYDVVTIPDGTTALSRPRDADVYLLDRELPDLDGDAVARRLRSRGFDGAIAMVTGQRPEPAIATLPIGEYVTKPVDGPALQSLVDRLEARLEAPDAIRELFGMVSRRGRLEDAHDRATLSDTDAYCALSRRLEDQSRRVHDGPVSPERVAALAEGSLDPTLDRPNVIAECLGTRTRSD